MNKLKQIPWEIEPHTQAKLEILKKYLQAWLPILSRFHGRIIYIDGFAGPGEYYYKNKIIDGSPIISIKSFLEHKLRDKIKEVIFIFVEKDQEVFKHLETKLEIYKKQGLKIETKNAEFENVINEIFDYLNKEHSTIAPTFCFIDPFGIKGLPLKAIKKIMGMKHCEVLINFMYEDLIRFITLPQNEKYVTELFYSEEWKHIEKIKEPKERYIFLTKLYQKRLEENCNIKYIHTFDMVNKFNKKDYVLFFCTNNKLGLEKMKESMWKIDPRGEFEFSDATYDPDQTVLFELKPNFLELRKMILKEYKGKEADINELEDFIITKTTFLKTHYKTSILKPMEKNNEIKVIYDKKRRMGTYPKDVIIRFL